MSNPSAAFFVNPLSHTVAKRGSVLDQSGAGKNVLRVQIDNFKSLADEMKNVAQAGVNTVFVEGGDGTIQAVLTEVLNHEKLFQNLPNIVLLPGGMTNLIVGIIGIKKPTPQKIDQLIDQPETARAAELPLLRIDPQESARTHYGFLFSSGALPAATQFCLDKIHTQGIGGAKAVRTTLFRVLMGRGEDREKILSPTFLRLDMDDRHLVGDHLTSLATTLPKLMIGINPFWGTEDRPVRLTHVGPPVHRKVKNIARMFKNNQSAKARASMLDDGFQSWNLNEATLTHDGPLVLDGEVLPDTKGPIKLSASTPLNFLR
jgi:hypothetical protein